MANIFPDQSVPTFLITSEFLGNLKEKAVEVLEIFNSEHEGEPDLALDSAVGHFEDLLQRLGDRGDTMPADIDPHARVDMLVIPGFLLDIEDMDALLDRTYLFAEGLLRGSVAHTAVGEFAKSLSAARDVHDGTIVMRPDGKFGMTR